jgi:D-serine deaminase-like pyridoxal phosphate-dependent protein
MTNFTVSNEYDIPSPALLVFRERLEANLALMLKISGGPERLRPHVKTHKLAQVVRRQIELGITKFKAATIAEAEMCAAAGAADVLLAFPPAGPAILRLCELARRFPSVTFGAIADNSPCVRGLSVAARAAGISLDVWIDIDCGMHRTGIAPGRDAEELWALIESSPGLRAAGLHAYDGHITEADPEVRRRLCEEAFAPVLALRKAIGNPPMIAGGTPTFPFHAAFPDRDCSPGTTVFWDWGYGEKFADMPFQIAAALLTRVVSKPSQNRLCLDLGHKAVAAENPLEMRTRIQGISRAKFVMHSEEHLVIEAPDAREIAVGECLYALPRHVCPTVALHAEAVVVEGEKAVDRWEIAARARRLTV